MSLKKFTISRDDSVYEAWPDVVLTNSGKLICIFSECAHHADRNGARIILKKSADRGRTWSEKIYFTEKGTKENYFNCPRISKLGDGSLTIICDKISGGENSFSEIYIWFGDPEGESWSKPLILPLCAIVPDKLLRLKNGRLIIAAHFKNPESEKLEQYMWYSDDDGKTWSERIIIGKDPEYNLCEASVLECTDGTLVAFMRENSGLGLDCMKAISHDSGNSWSGIYKTPIPACHRPVAGILRDGCVMITHRFMQGGKGWLGSWTQNTFAAFMTQDDVKKTKREEQSARIFPLDFDRSSVSDCGYTGFAQFDDGEIYVVNYIVDDAPSAYIRGYSFRKSDVLIERKE